METTYSFGSFTKPKQGQQTIVLYVLTTQAGVIYIDLHTLESVLIYSMHNTLKISLFYWDDSTSSDSLAETDVLSNLRKKYVGLDDFLKDHHSEYLI